VILTVGEVAERFKLSTKTVYRALERGSLRAAKFGSAWRIRVEDADAWFEHCVPTRDSRGEPRRPRRVVARRPARGSFRSLMEGEESAA
jgi:excisionase family DNA binding protein